MNLKNTFFVLFYFLISCVGGSQEFQLARKFIDAYYVMADQTKALEMASDVAQLKLLEEKKLLQNVSEKQNSYRTRDIEFFLKKEDVSTDEVQFMFELKIHHANSEPTLNHVFIIVDRKNQKVKYFGEPMR